MFYVNKMCCGITIIHGTIIYKFRCLAKTQNLYINETYTTIHNISHQQVPGTNSFQKTTHIRIRKDNWFLGT